MIKAVISIRIMSVNRQIVSSRFSDRSTEVCKVLLVRLEDAKSDMSAGLMVSIADGKKKIWEKQIDQI